MSSISSLVTACKTGLFPSLEAMYDFGINNHVGINPIHMFECYRLAVNNDSVNGSLLCAALKKNSLNQLIMESPSVRKSRYYNEIIEKGGISNGFYLRMNECDICSKVSTGLCAHLNISVYK